ncbi:MAG: [Lachnospiraceae bacterium]|nr:[FeFe] hydrogenase H-cluster radical SAM maturase HydE [Lachnospiraceae bacterium]
MGKAMSEYVDELLASGSLEKARFTELLKFRNLETTSYLFERAARLRDQVHGNQITVLGRIMISNYCKNECKMCGIRRENRFVQRFRLSIEQILSYCDIFYKKGIRNLLLESGDDSYLTEEGVAEIIHAIKENHSKFHIYLSLGEKKKTAFLHWRATGAEGYFISHGSANDQHFKKLFPSNMSPLLKKQSIWELKEIGCHIGGSLLIGTPYQTIDHVLEDIFFLKTMLPDLLSIGTFLPVPKSVLADQRSGNGEMALYIMAILRLLLPGCHLFADPVIDCVFSDGRMTAFDAGADLLLVDVPDSTLVDRYGVYERKHRRLPLPADDLDSFLEKLLARGFVVA